MLQFRPGPGIALHDGLITRREKDLHMVQTGGHEGTEIRRIEGSKYFRHHSVRITGRSREPRQHLHQGGTGEGVELCQAEIDRLSVNG